MQITLEQVRDYCAKNLSTIEVKHDGTVFLKNRYAASARTTSEDELRSLIAASEGVQVTTGMEKLARDLPEGYAPFRLNPRQDAIYLQAEGYEPLALVLQRAFNQAAHGKGKERHAQGEPFTGQVMQDMARRFGVGALLGQAFKKSEESQRLPHDRAVAELLGAINYLAGAVIAMEARRSHANDNTPSEGAKRA